MAFKITESCIRCSICEFSCFFNAISLHPEDEYYSIDPGKCVHCGECADDCPLGAIVSTDPARQRISMVRIIDENCIACILCQRKCPVDAISGVLKVKPFVINQEKCIHCGLCIPACHKDAIEVSYALYIYQ